MPLGIQCQPAYTVSAREAAGLYVTVRWCTAAGRFPETRQRSAASDDGVRWRPTGSPGMPPGLGCQKGGHRMPQDGRSGCRPTRYTLAETSSGGDGGAGGGGGTFGTVGAA